MAERDDLTRRVLTTMGEAFPNSAGKMADDTTQDQVEQWDSLGHLRLCMAIEQRFSVSLPTDVIPELTSTRSIVDQLESLLGN